MVTIRELNSWTELAEMYEVVYRAYLAMGYTPEMVSGELRHYPHLNGIPETTVFGAFDHEGKMVGTNSLTVDGPQKLHVDDDFPDQVHRIREWCKSYGLNLGASWRIVTDKSVGSCFDILMPLIAATIRKGCDLGLHVTLFDFHPRHGKVYERLLGLEPVAHDICRAAGGSPAVLMLGDSRRIRAHWGNLRCGDWGEDMKVPVWPEGVETWDTWHGPS
jgi:hypothetical protein